jgi:hypothetical protein
VNTHARLSRLESAAAPPPCAACHKPDGSPRWVVVDPDEPDAPAPRPCPACGAGPNIIRLVYEDKLAGAGSPL